MLLQVVRELELELEWDLEWEQYELGQLSELVKNEQELY